MRVRFGDLTRIRSPMNPHRSVGGRQRGPEAREAKPRALFDSAPDLRRSEGEMTDEKHDFRCKPD
jgi:hypothetical protein